MLGFNLALGILCAMRANDFASDFIILLVITVIFVIMNIFMIDSCIRNYIDLHEDNLVIRLSFFRVTIQYSQIREVRETNSVWASLSTSLDRLKIGYKNYDEVMVAVQDKNGFLQELAKRNPSILVVRKTDKASKNSG